MANIHPLLDAQKQNQARQYEKQKRLLGLAGSGLFLLILLIFYFSGLSYKVAGLSIGGTKISTPFIYIAILFTLLALTSYPLNFYSSFIHEHRWKFSNHTFKTWLWEQIKAFLVGLVLASLLLSLLFWILDRFPDFWWLLAGLLMAGVSVVLATLFPVVILPIFNKYTPIQDQELTESLEKILAKGGLKSSSFFKEDMSRQTKKENAFLAGLGKTRRVVLADNLLDHMTVPEIQSIIAHEVGHYKYKHIWVNILLGSLQQIVIFFFMNEAMKALFPKFLFSMRWNLTLFPVFAVLIGAFSFFLFGPLGHGISRFFERQADNFALQHSDDKHAFMTALAGLADRNLSNAYPEWWVKWLFYSHPPIGERLETAERFK